MSSMSTQAGAPSETFRQLVTALYGESVDPAAVWNVAKASPDQADLRTARNAKIRRNVERGSNAVGITAGSLGLAAALKDPRLAHGGRIARTLASTGRKMPEVLGRIKSPRVQAGLAAGAVGTQVGNLGGDALIAGTLGEKPKKNVAKRLVPVDKKAAAPGLDKVAAGLRRVWSGQTAAAKPKAPPGPVGSTGAHPKWHAAGADLGEALSTKSGKVMAGGLAVAGGSAANRRVRRNSAGVDYAPDYYYKRDDTVDVEFTGTFSKLDTDKRLAFGWASVTKVNGTPIVDKQGDYIDLGDLEEAAYTYVHSSRVGGDMHKRAESMQGPSAYKVSDMVESIVFTPEKIEAMGLPREFPQGWWVGYRVHDDETWDLVKKGERTGFSIHGRGLRKSADLDEIMGYR